MTYWNHRVIRKEDAKTETVSFQIHEVYYSDDGAIEGWTQDPVSPFGETEYELREEIRYFLQAFRYPILEEKEEDGKSVLVENEWNSTINSGHYFEYMDRSSVALDYVYQFLGSHPLLKKEARLKEAYERAEEALANLYQVAGQLEHEISKS